MIAKVKTCVLFTIQQGETEYCTAHTDGPIFVPAGGDVVRCRHRLAIVGEVRNVEYRQWAVDVALHGVIRVISIWVHRERPVVDQPWNHVGCKSNDHGLLRHQDSKTCSESIKLIIYAVSTIVASVLNQLITQCKQYCTFVATANIAMPWRMGCQAPISWAFSGTMRRNWVVIFQASTRISNMLLTRARTGAKGKEATNRVTKPNWMTAKHKIYV